MDVVSQALQVAAVASEGAVDGIIGVDFDLEVPAHRAAYAAAMAVLASFGEAAAMPALPVPVRVSPEAETAGAIELEPEISPLDEAMRRSYQSAMDDLTGDPARAVRVVADTFPLVRDVLRDGANVEGVAHVQYMRWSDAQRAVRSALD